MAGLILGVYLSMVLAFGPLRARDSQASQARRPSRHARRSCWRTCQISDVLTSSPCRVSCLPESCLPTGESITQKWPAQKTLSNCVKLPTFVGPPCATSNAEPVFRRFSWASLIAFSLQFVSGVLVCCRQQSFPFCSSAPASYLAFASIFQLNGGAIRRRKHIVSN